MHPIQTPNAPAAIGPYSQGMELGNLVFTSGQIPVDPITGLVSEGIEAQTHRSCQNVGAILEAAGVDFTKVFKKHARIVSGNFVRGFLLFPCRLCHFIFPVVRVRK